MSFFEVFQKLEASAEIKRRKQQQQQEKQQQQQ